MKNGLCLSLLTALLLLTAACNKKDSDPPGVGADDRYVYAGKSLRLIGPTVPASPHEIKADVRDLSLDASGNLNWVAYFTYFGPVHGYERGTINSSTGAVVNGPSEYLGNESFVNCAFTAFRPGTNTLYSSYTHGLDKDFLGDVTWHYVGYQEAARITANGDYIVNSDLSYATIGAAVFHNGAMNAYAFPSVIMDPDSPQNSDRYQCFSAWPIDNDGHGVILAATGRYFKAIPFDGSARDSLRLPDYGGNMPLNQKMRVKNAASGSIVIATTGERSLPTGSEIVVSTWLYNPVTRKLSAVLENRSMPSFTGDACYDVNDAGEVWYAGRSSATNLYHMTPAGTTTFATDVLKQFGMGWIFIRSNRIFFCVEENIYEVED